jgi:hypothetical protein
VLTNLPGFRLVVSLICAAIPSKGLARERFLKWILLLPTSAGTLWAAVSHLAFPALAAHYIDWQPSPFQFEVGTADLAFGILGLNAQSGHLPAKEDSFAEGPCLPYVLRGTLRQPAILGSLDGLQATLRRAAGDEPIHSSAKKALGTGDVQSHAATLTWQAPFALRLARCLVHQSTNICCRMGQVACCR